MNFVLQLWRQKNPQSEGAFSRYEVGGITPDMSFLEMLDTLNEQLASKGEAPVAFESDCREGICGSCGVMINGAAHGPIGGTTVCQLYMRHFSDGEELVIEPWRARAFPVLRDLIVDRSAFDRIISAGGFISVPTGAAPEASSAMVPKQGADAAMDSAACIGCGACVAACPNASAALFVGAKLSHLGLLPQGQPERARRALAMVARMDDEGFGNCSWHGECQAACPKSISIDTIARTSRDWSRAKLADGRRSTPDRTNDSVSEP
ncbi:succinate dehydrogenase/fumarate reductase iron-sulfur subunit [Corallococcus sp. CA049B]|uniref:succinate dehydrogenase/fumarate reductase iron-sulfur subunit n=1 Tax=Corallococcus sp. CA049B TaxID=2316730 RepID=UPI000EA25E51|nr:succinate dehydrogenase/fumarate reductase iron-sulfur subunit [Corallococcus sp. CA049B]RKG87049.1 succinate dehydrogenase/fumarate reductase iron-sulfur subunit [Corallococcus sp. CA049B]